MIRNYENKTQTTESVNKSVIDELSRLQSEQSELRSKIRGIETAIANLGREVETVERKIINGSGSRDALDVLYQQQTEARQKQVTLNEQLRRLEGLVQRATAMRNEEIARETAQHRDDLTERYGTAIQKFSEALLTAAAAYEQARSIYDEAYQRFPHGQNPAAPAIFYEMPILRWSFLSMRTRSRFIAWLEEVQQKLRSALPEGAAELLAAVAGLGHDPDAARRAAAFVEEHNKIKELYRKHHGTFSESVTIPRDLGTSKVEYAPKKKPAPPVSKEKIEAGFFHGV